MSSRVKLYYIFKLKCPKCHKGDLFTRPRLFLRVEIFKMPENCKDCNQDFKIESGFYSAALWISYPLAFLLLIMFVFLIIWFSDNYGVSLNILIPLFIIFYILLQIPIIRLSRAILIHMTINYFRTGQNK